MKITLQICVDLEQVEKLYPAPDFFWCMKVKCGNCGTESPAWHNVSESDETPYTDVQGTVNFGMKCKFCRRPGCIDVIKDSTGEYKEEHSGQFSNIVSFQFRGIEPFEFSFEKGWCVKVLDSNKVFEDVNLSEDWVEYDDKNNVPVSISDMKYKFIRE